jgi:hypothetical protein
MSIVPVTRNEILAWFKFFIERVTLFDLPSKRNEEKSVTLV